MQTLIMYLAKRDLEYCWLRSKGINNVAGEILRLLYYRQLTGFKLQNTTTNISNHIYGCYQQKGVNRALKVCINIGYIIRHEYANKTHYTLTSSFIKEYKKVLRLELK